MDLPLTIIKPILINFKLIVPCIVFEVVHTANKVIFKIKKAEKRIRRHSRHQEQERERERERAIPNLPKPKNNFIVRIVIGRRI